MSLSTIGVIGSRGDLGSQLSHQLKMTGYSVVESDVKLPQGVKTNELIASVDIIHVCAPLSVLENSSEIPDSAIIILHDSVMSSSKQASDRYLHGQASVVHMLMNSHDTVILELDTPHMATVNRHFESMGYNVVTMSAKEHDRLMAESQAPLALLVEAIHQPLKEYRYKGLLTPSGELLAQTLDARSIAWTPETIQSILKNPELSHLLSDMHTSLQKLPPTK